VSSEFVVVSASQYTGWLLRVNRRLAVDPDLRVGKRFAGAFGEVSGRALAPSHVTRWEHGELWASRTTVRRYERLLGLVPDSMVTIIDAAWRAKKVATAHAGPTIAGPTVACAGDNDDRIHELLEIVEVGAEMTGAGWSELAELVTGSPWLLMHPPQLWRVVTDRLLAEMAVAEGDGWWQRQEAMSRLLEHPRARRYAVAACIDCATDPSTPAVIEPLSLLDVVSSPEANRFVVRQVERPDSDRALQGALLAAARKAYWGHFHDVEMTSLIGGVRRLMRDPTLPSHLLPLAIELGRGLARRRPGEATLRRYLPPVEDIGQMWDTGRIAAPDVTTLVSRRIAANAQARMAEGGHRELDEILVELIEESLFASGTDDRLVAAMMIKATPYRDQVAAEILREMRSDLSRRSETLPAVGLRTMTNLGVDLHRPLIYDLLCDPGTGAVMRHAAAWATPHCAGRHSQEQWRRMLGVQFRSWIRSAAKSGDAILQGVVYGIGTDQHAALLAEVRDNPGMPASARATATWLTGLRTPT
jgi:hypothetical protein